MAQDNFDRINQLNSQIYSAFCRIERKFYETAVSHYGLAQPSDIAKFFSVKGIGDEVWILCEVPTEEIPQAGWRLIDAGIQVAAESVHLLATQHKDGPDFVQNFDYGQIEPVTSPVKVFIDLVNHASNLGSIRDEELRKAIPGLLKEFHRREPTSSEITNVTRRLCFATFEPMGWSANRQYRTDFIGHEIDRFFRTTKAALPGTVTIGAAMAQHMRLMFRPATQGIHTVHTDANLPLTVGVPPDPLYCYIRNLQPDQLKGIDYAYNTYTLFAPRTLNDMYVQMRADQENRRAAMPYGDTAKLIPPRVVQDLVRKLMRERP